MARIEPFEKYLHQYEAWFEENRYAYESELEAIRKLFPEHYNSVEIGVGSGRFAKPLGIIRGLVPSVRMGETARQRGITVNKGICENLPYVDAEFDLVLMVSTICFLDDVERSFGEVSRILKPGGWFIIGFIDKYSPIGKLDLKYRKKNVFYQFANIYSVEKVIQILNKTRFTHLQFTQTIFHQLEEIKEIEPVKQGYGTGSFVVARAQKRGNPKPDNYLH